MELLKVYYYQRTSLPALFDGYLTKGRTEGLTA